MRHATVQRVAFAEQVAQSRQRIIDLQQGSVRVVTQAPKEFFRRGAQVEDVRSRMQRFAIGRSQHGAAACGDDRVGQRRDLFDHILLDVAEGIFTLPCEPLADGNAQALLDGRVAVNELQPEVPRELTPDSGLATAGHADKRKTQGQIEGRAALVITVMATVVPSPLGEVNVTKTTPIDGDEALKL